MIRKGNLLRVDSEEDLRKTFHIDSEEPVSETNYYVTNCTYARYYDLKYVIHKDEYPAYFILRPSHTCSFEPTVYESIPKEDLLTMYHGICLQQETYKKILDFKY